jgi:translation initiation factor 2 alpha subunit (eIF-2alpha)
MSSFKIRFNDKLFNLPWYQNTIPTKDTIIIGKVDKIDDYGVTIKILNYNKIEGYIAVNELSRKRLRTIRSIMKIGDIKPLLVINTNIKNNNLFVDLSNKQIVNTDDEIDKLEKYYRLINILHSWMKYIYKSHYFKGNYISDFNESINIMIEKEINKIPKLKSCDTLYEEDIDEDNEKITIIPYDIEDWKKICNLILWKESTNDIYEDFMNIKMKNKNFDDVFPELIEAIKENKLDTNMLINIEDIDRLKILIDKFINYDINIKIQIKLTCWSLNSLDTIKNIINKLNKLPDEKYDGLFNFYSVILNSPTYEFYIKSTNKYLIDKIFPEGISVGDSELGEYISNILNEFDDIEYEIEIERKDII